MAIPHGERCFCDDCIQQRVKAKRAKAYRDKDVESYIKRRGGTLDNPPPSKAKGEKR